MKWKLTNGGINKIACIYAHLSLYEINLIFTARSFLSLEAQSSQRNVLFSFAGRRRQMKIISPCGAEIARRAELFS
jgi:hypothetical protein